MATSRSRKHPKRLVGGPYDGKTLYISDDASSTITFRLHDFYGRYAEGGAHSELYWQAMEEHHETAQRKVRGARR